MYSILKGINTLYYSNIVASELQPSTQLIFIDNQGRQM